MSTAHVLGFPRIGAQRELPDALERYWQAGQSADAERALRETGRALRAAHWRVQRDAGLDWVTVGDFAWYDPVLTTLAYLGGLPARFGFDPRALTLADYFAAARGDAAQPAMDSAAWFDTNSRYRVPEYGPQTQFGAGVDWLFDELREARALGHPVKVALIGPLTLLWLGREGEGLADRLALLPRLLPAYQVLLARLKADGVEWVQIDEPLFAADLPAAWRDAVPAAYQTLAPHAPRLLLSTYFGDVSEHAALLKSLPVAGLHVDCAGVATSGVATSLDAFAADYPADKVLSCGIVDGRNVWRHDLERSLARLAPVRERLGERLWIATSCALQHVPVDLRGEARLDDELKSWLAFAAQKTREVAVLRDALVHGRRAMAAEFDAAAAALASRRTSARIHNPLVQRRVASLTDADAQRSAAYPARAALQRARFQLPLLPTTTVGSFPQTDEIRTARTAFAAGALDHLGYLEAMRDQVKVAIDKQLAYGLDVLVHGEAERSDMVEYFSEQLWGFALTRAGWVQHDGAQCVKPALIYGDVYLPEPITVGWAQYAQSLTDKPVKGMLTGPVTMLQGSFVRDDQPRAVTALQIALALRQETIDLEKAGIGMIQIDEPALRDGMPLKARERAAYLEWAVRAFRVASSGVGAATQIHTHMCHAAFGDILPTIAALDADVISIETSRANQGLLDAFDGFAYPNEIGPGVYDIHAPRVPGVDEIAGALTRALERIPAERLWVNPDCGLRAREWAQVDAALTAMVAAARRVREGVAATV
jgi:5-methyltetrahydropteroyltriglutamate--homocysteine methyltransferase